MIKNQVNIAGLHCSNTSPLLLMAGVNVLESRDMTLRVADTLKSVCERLSIPLVFKASFDKANRSSVESYRGIGWDASAKVFEELKREFDLPIVTDIHEPEQASVVGEVVDLIQIPAFLCRQTDLVVAAAAVKKPIHVKKMQMMAPWDMKNVVEKFSSAGCKELILCERGVGFGYNNLIVDPLGLTPLKDLGCPVSFDVTHSLQQPGGLGKATAGRGQQALELACSIVIQGVAALFLETHPDPSKAKCDGPCATPLADVEDFLRTVKRVDELGKEIFAK